MLQRPELFLLDQLGYRIENPHDAVFLFEQEVAKYTSAPYCVVVDCLTHAVELCLRYLNVKPGQTIDVPRQTYPSIPMTVIKLGAQIRWTQQQWEGCYQLDPTPVVDSALHFAPDIYRPGQFLCLSFQHKKRLPIGRGGAILCDQPEAYEWLRRACYDGRTPGLSWKEDEIYSVGYHYYMTPEDAARGLILLNELKTTPDKCLPSILGGYENYPDISQMPVFANGPQIS